MFRGPHDLESALRIRVRRRRLPLWFDGRQGARQARGSREYDPPTAAPPSPPAREAGRAIERRVERGFRVVNEVAALAQSCGPIYKHNHTRKEPICLSEARRDRLCVCTQINVMVVLSCDQPYG